MAYRDRSQGFGFVYLDIAELLRKKDEFFSDETNTPIKFPESSQQVNFNKDPREAVPVESTAKPVEKTQNVQKLQENLDRLQSLHHKLHVMLEELNQISKKHSKKTDKE